MRTRTLAPPWHDPTPRVAPLFTPQEWAEFYYRIEVWGFGVSIGGDATSGTFDNLFSVGGTIGPTNEQEIIRYDVTNDSVEQDGINIDFQWSAKPYFHPDGWWIPRLDVTIVHGDNTVTTRTDTSADLLSAFTGTILGLALPPFYEASGEVSTGSLEIVGEQWWERRKGDNTEPIWDQADGTALLSPLQGELR